MPKEKPGFLLVHTPEPNAHRYDVYVSGVQVPEDERRRFVSHRSAIPLLATWRLQKTGHFRFDWLGHEKTPSSLKAYFYPYWELSPSEREALERHGVARRLLLKALEHLHTTVGNLPVDYMPATAEAKDFFQSLGIDISRPQRIGESIELIKKSLRRK